MYSHNKLALFLHLVWATWDREPSITPVVERAVFRTVEAVCQTEHCTVVALNGVADHVHLLVGIPATISVADLVKHIKGARARYVNETVQPAPALRWQPVYGAFTVSRWDVTSIADYVRRQKAHHAAGTLVDEYEAITEEAPLADDTAVDDRGAGHPAGAG